MPPDTDDANDDKDIDADEMTGDSDLGNTDDTTVVSLTNVTNSSALSLVTQTGSSLQLNDNFLSGTEITFYSNGYSDDQTDK